MNFEILGSFLVASMILTVMPGPDIVYVLAQSITNGKKYGIATAAGLASGIIIHTTLVAFGVSAIIQQSPQLFWSIKLFGAIYLLYLAFLTFKSTSEIKLDAKVTKKDFFNLYKQGFIMNVLNPKVSIFFLAFFPGFLYHSTQNTVIQFYVLGLIFMIQAFVIFSLVALLSGKFSMYLKTNPTFNTNLKWFKILVFIGIAIFIVLT
ncbi:LysE family translocator [Lutibacter sp.]|uniref:LysE family translocator n=1 Tax=Lutibacter sp. TaxID=1925666 RepID=UPI00273731B5|nr:LysE family translocator [Lutibacter sp.]MDP3312607.1 LysE family translocator [Lutibacter sp.]